MVVFRGEWIYEWLFPCRRLLLEELPAPSGGLQQPSNQAVIATCHALRWRQRYCQTRYTRRQYDLIPRDKSRSLTLGYTQVSDLLSHGVISKSYSYGNEPLSVPTNNKKWIASRLIKSMRFTHPRSIWYWRRTILRRLHHYDAGIIIKLYSCNIIHEISHSHCSVVRQGLTIHTTFLRRELAELELTLHEGDFLRSYVANRMLKVMQHNKLSLNRLLWSE